MATYMLENSLGKEQRESPSDISLDKLADLPQLEDSMRRISEQESLRPESPDILA
ncbi:uncharacterized protein VTP21DRAFT_8630 [Calcarisporiella thermophila]|uniref:uncharacterized protein n=1 Tax=Calcarisporiella thermophila TaxID=911321 RepID=UPI003742355B